VAKYIVFKLYKRNFNWNKRKLNMNDYARKYSPDKRVDKRNILDHNI